VPHGSIISPILSNLYLDKFDKMIKEIKIKLEIQNKNKRSNIINPEYATNIINPEYAKLDNTIQNITKSKKSGKICKDKEERLALRAKLIKVRRKVRSTIPNPGVTKIYYVRYADDWLIGIYGSSKYTTKLKAYITEWLKINLKLELSQEKTLITKADTSHTKFLGVKISRLSGVNNLIKNDRSRFNHFVGISSTILLKAPIKELINKFMEKGLAEYKLNSRNKKILVGKPINKWQNLPLIDILIRYKAI
jgi:hypothetical protein